MWTEKKKDISQIEKIFDSETILNTEKGILHSELGTDLKRQKQNIYHSHCLKATWLSEITLNQWREQSLFLNLAVSIQYFTKLPFMLKCSNFNVES